MLHKAVPTAAWADSFAGDTGWSYQIRYSTASFCVLTANLCYQLGEDAGNIGKNNVGASIVYNTIATTHSAYIANVLMSAPGHVRVSAVAPRR